MENYKSAKRQEGLGGGPEGSNIYREQEGLNRPETTWVWFSSTHKNSWNSWKRPHTPVILVLWGARIIESLRLMKSAASHLEIDSASMNKWISKRGGHWAFFFSFHTPVSASAYTRAFTIHAYHKHTHYYHHHHHHAALHHTCAQKKNLKEQEDSCKLS